MEEIKYKYKYNCEQCDFRANYNSTWLKHIETEFHKTGKRKIRSDNKISEKCPSCEYKTKSINNINMRTHILNTHSTKEERKEKFKYYCECCNFGCFAYSQINNHNNTIKHKYNTEILNKNKD